MQYLRCFDYSTKCLLLIIQRAEVLLNFLVSVGVLAFFILNWCQGID